MNLYFRMITMFIASMFKGSVSAFDGFSTNHCVFPNDLDLFGHMNNGRYFTITDLARVEMLVRSGIWRSMRSKGLFPVMAAETAQFFKPLMPFARYKINTRTLGWDEKYFYVEHRFQRGQSKHALMLVKVRVIGKGDLRMSPADVLNLTYPDQVEAVKTHPLIDAWNQSTELHRQAAV